MRPTSTSRKGLWLACLLAVSLAQSAWAASESDADDDGSVTNPAISNAGNPGVGWTALPTVAGASIDNSTIVVGKNATLLHYIDADYDPSQIKRIVVQVHGDSRDAWNQWLYADLAAKRAEQGGTVKRKEVLVVAPQFFERVDLGAYPFIAVNRTASTTPATSVHISTPSVRSQESTQLASSVSLVPRSPLPAASEPSTTPSHAASAESGTLHRSEERPSTAPVDPSAIMATDTAEFFSSSQVMIWSGVNWGDGSPASDPPGNDPAGAFDALDSLLDYLLDQDRFPSVNRLVLAGFSLGGQLVQRYAAFRHDTDDDDRITFWVSSPNSFVYFNETRPVTPKKACKDTYNDYKYGLSGALPTYVTSNPTGAGAAEVVQRYLNRTIVYLCGTRDKMAGTDDCSSNAQGAHHVAKMLYWTKAVIPWLPGAPQNGSLPANSSVHWIDRTSHQDWKIITSDPGVQTLILEKYNDDGSDAAAPPSSGVGEAPEPGAESGALSSLATPSLTAMLLLLAATVSTALLV
ncbi:hypothetical protein ACQY0O_003983 [Thecaphora frezii]